MKKIKRTAWLLALLLICCCPLAAAAEDDADKAAVETDEAAIETAVTADETSVVDLKTEADGAEKSPAERLAAFLLPHLSDLAVAAAAVWLAFPKWGGVAVITRLLRHIRTYFDDERNSRSVYNLLAANADAVGRFMSDAAPLLSDLREGREALIAAEAALLKSAGLTEEQKELLTAARGSLSLLSAELYRVVAALPDTDEATRARFEAMLAAVTSETQDEGAENDEKTDMAV